MGATVAYIRVSTDDQVEYSPDAQRKRCLELARLRGLPPCEFFSDEGWSGKNLERPKMRELISRIEGGEVENVIVWRWDRLSRDQGDFSRLVNLFKDQGVQVYSVNEGPLDPSSASGRMQAGMHGVIAQYQRDQIVENTKMGTRQAVEKGRWTNRAPSGYQMVNKRLVPSVDAPLIVRAFELRAAGWGFQKIADELGMKYSTIQHICQNRVYIGEVQLNGQWFDGIHTPLITLRLFNAAQGGHTPGIRRSRELLSGKVRCGICCRVAGVKYNERKQVLYKCRHRGRGCKQPARAANGLHRAARLAITLLGSDADLLQAIHDELTRERPDESLRERSTSAAIAALKARQKKLLALYYADQIDGVQFGAENADLVQRIASMEKERGAARRAREARTGAAAAFDQVAELLESADFGILWDAASEEERQVLINDLIDSIHIYPDLLTVQVVGAPAIKITLEEVGLVAGSKTVVSETRLARSPTGGYVRGRVNDFDFLCPVTTHLRSGRGDGTVADRKRFSCH